MKQGDFSQLARQYANRPGYSEAVLEMLISQVKKNKEQIEVCEVGAGTGKLTEQLQSLNLSGVAVEPNDEMRREGKNLTVQNSKFSWVKATGEDTLQENDQFDWVIMASSFHWTDHTKSLPEFSRILKPGGYFTALWNPRDIQRSEFHQGIEDFIYSLVPDLNRVSSGNKKNLTDIEEKLKYERLFTNLVFVEASYDIEMSVDRYLGAWKSVNDIQSQAGPEKWKEILAGIHDRVKHLEVISVPYKTRAWTVQVAG